MKDSNMFICYSIPLKRKFEQYGIKYNVAGLSMTPPHNPFYVYEKTDTLNCILTEWQNNKACRQNGSVI